MEAVACAAQFEGDRRAYSVDAKPRATGGYGEIFEATVKATGVRVAFKRLHDTLPESKGRFAREIRIQTTLAPHPHVMPILDADPNGRWCVMPLAEGDAEEFADELRDESALSELIRHAVAGLEAGHAIDHVHRDVTPRNLLAFGPEGGRRWVLGDWGLVRQPHGKTTRRYTRTGVAIGTDGFIAPELLRDAHREAKASADVFSLGQVIGWAVTGQWPLAGERLVPSGPFRRLVQRATAIDALQRPTLDELLALLDAVEFTPPMDPLTRAEELAEHADNDEQAVELIELALEHLEEHAIFFDALPAVRGDQLKRFVRERSDDAEQLVRAMREHLADSHRWGGRHYDLANQPLLWLQLVTASAIGTGDLGLAEDAAEALFESEARWDRFEQRRRTRSFLEQLKGDDAANAVARALRRAPQAVEWYLREDWRPAERTHRAIRAALSVEAQPRKPRPLLDPQIGDLQAILVPGDTRLFSVGEPVNVASAVQPIHALPVTLAVENISDVTAIITDISGSSSDYGRLSFKHASACPPRETTRFECWLSTISSASRLPAGSELAIELRYYEGATRVLATLSMTIRHNGGGMFSVESWRGERAEAGEVHAAAGAPT